jgi:hypothetical protein
MPKVSTRRKTINEIDSIIFALILEDTPQNGNQVEELLELKAHILSYRYFSPVEVIPKSLEHRTILLTLPINEFRQAFRGKKDTFAFILNRIQDHQVFQNNGLCKQQPVWVQLLVV